jgi:hypothetical protein
VAIRDDCPFNNIAKIYKTFVLHHIGEFFFCNFIKIGHILCNENKIVNELMNAFLN